MSGIEFADYGTGSFLPESITGKKTSSLSDLEKKKIKDNYKQKTTPKKDVGDRELFGQKNSSTTVADTPAYTSSDTNVFAGALDRTKSEYADNAKARADEIKRLADARAEQEQGIIRDRDAGARGRVAESEKDLQRIKAEAEARMNARRGDAAKSTAMQDRIASRQANMAVAKSGASGLLLSDSTIQNVLDDTAAKYGENIKSAMDFELQTNISLDSALTSLDKDIFKSRENLNIILNELDAKEYAPLLTAIKAAYEGDQKAIDDVYSFGQEILKKRSATEFMNADALERMRMQEQQWSVNSLIEKQNDIDLSMSGTSGYNEVAALIPKLLADYPNLSRAAFIAKIKTLAQEKLNSTTLKGIIANSPENLLLEPWKNLIKETFDVNTTVSSSDQNNYKQNNKTPRNLDNPSGGATGNDGNTGGDTGNVTGSQTGVLKKVNYTGVSIIDYLNLQGLDSSEANRRKLAEQYGIKNYDTIAEKNTELLNKMRAAEGSSISTNTNIVNDTGTILIKNDKGEDPIGQNQDGTLIYPSDNKENLDSLGIDSTTETETELERMNREMKERQSAQIKAANGDTNPQMYSADNPKFKVGNNTYTQDKINEAGIEALNYIDGIIAKGEPTSEESKKVRTYLAILQKFQESGASFTYDLNKEISEASDGIRLIA